ncbi:MAG: glycerophosphodiester phosphodiesterase [Candidatus Hydrothermarchaeaceae archaeon]
MKVEDALKDSWDVFRRDYIAYIIGGGIAVLGSIFIITVAPLLFGLYHMAIKGLKGEDVEIADVLWGFGRFLRSWALLIVGGVIVIAGLVLLVVPGLVLIVLFQYSIPAIVLKDCGAIEGLMKSLNVAKNNFAFSVLVAATSFVVNFIGGSIWIGWVISVPFTALIVSRAAMHLMEKESP